MKLMKWLLVESKLRGLKSDYFSSTPLTQIFSGLLPSLSSVVVPQVACLQSHPSRSTLYSAVSQHLKQLYFSLETPSPALYRLWDGISLLAGKVLHSLNPACLFSLRSYMHLLYTLVLAALNFLDL